MVYKPDLMDIDEARDEMEYCLSTLPRRRKGDTATADRFLVLALTAEQSYQRIRGNISINCTTTKGDKMSNGNLYLGKGLLALADFILCGCLFAPFEREDDALVSA
jgi:hypothetical protein